MLSGSTDGCNDISWTKGEVLTGLFALLAEKLTERSRQVNPLRFCFAVLVFFGAERHHERSRHAQTRFGEAPLERGGESNDLPSPIEPIG